MMIQSIVSIGSITAVIAATVIACSSPSVKTAEQGLETDSSSRVRRGEYLVNIVGCDDCHSPKRMGPMGPEIIPEL